MTGFLDALALPDEERKKLEALGAKTPLGLLSMRKASPEAFDAYLGADRADAIARQLESLLREDEKAELLRPLPAGRSLGARMPPAPPKKP